MTLRRVCLNIYYISYRLHTSLCPWLADYILQRKNENFINALIHTIVFSSSIQEILNSVKKRCLSIYILLEVIMISHDEKMIIEVFCYRRHIDECAHSWIVLVYIIYRGTNEKWRILKSLTKEAPFMTNWKEMLSVPHLSAASVPQSLHQTLSCTCSEPVCR